MLYIVTKEIRFETPRTREYEWHVGEKNPLESQKNNVTSHIIECVTEVQADGDELGHIEYNFPTMPRARGKRVVRWFGTDAKFIAANL